MQTLTLSNPAAVAVLNGQELTRCLIVVLRRGGAEILVSGQAPKYRLPAIEVPAQQRIPPSLLPLVETQLGLRAVVRFAMEPENRSFGRRSVVLDALDFRTPEPAGHIWLPVDAVRWDDFVPDARESLWSALVRVNAYATGRRSGNFVRAGWYEEIRAWTENSLAGSGLRLGDLSMQHNPGPDCALLRFRTSGPAVWFKAVGPRCAREFAITRTLSDTGIPHITRVLALREDWRAWLSIEASGRHPDTVTSVFDREVAARCLSELQVASIPHVGALLAAGARDLRTDYLYEAIEPCLSRLSVLMKLQPAVPPDRLGTEEFLMIEKQLRRACRRLTTLGIPDTLGQSDFSAGNILIDGSDAVCLDWAESHVGPPLLTFAYLELLMGGNHSCPRTWKAYLEPWNQEGSAMPLGQLLAIAPLLAVFAYVAVCDAPEQRPEELEPERSRRLRSLTRRMYVEARNSEPSLSSGKQ